MHWLNHFFPTIAHLRIFTNRGTDIRQCLCMISPVYVGYCLLFFILFFPSVSDLSKIDLKDHFRHTYH